MRMTIINKGTGEVEHYIECGRIGFVNAVKAITLFGTAYECKRRGYKPWEIVYDIEVSWKHFVVSSEQYVLSFK